MTYRYRVRSSTSTSIESCSMWRSSRRKRPSTKASLRVAILACRSFASTWSWAMFRSVRRFRVKRRRSSPKLTPICRNKYTYFFFILAVIRVGQTLNVRIRIHICGSRVLKLQSKRLEFLDLKIQYGIKKLYWLYSDSGYRILLWRTHWSRVWVLRVQNFESSELWLTRLCLWQHLWDFCTFVQV